MHLCAAHHRGGHSRSNPLEEVVAGSSPVRWNVALLVGNGGEDTKSGIQILFHRHDGGNVAATVAVVRGRPHCDDRVLWEVVLEDVSAWKPVPNSSNLLTL